MKTTHIEKRIARAAGGRAGRLRSAASRLVAFGSLAPFAPRNRGASESPGEGGLQIGGIAPGPSADRVHKCPSAALRLERTREFGSFAPVVAHFPKYFDSGCPFEVSVFGKHACVCQGSVVGSFAPECLSAALRRVVRSRCVFSVSMSALDKGSVGRLAPCAIIVVCMGI